MGIPGRIPGYILTRTPEGILERFLSGTPGGIPGEVFGKKYKIKSGGRIPSRIIGRHCLFLNRKIV